MWFEKKNYTLEDLNKEIVEKIKKLSKKYETDKGVKFSEIVSDYASMRTVLLMVEKIVDDEIRSDEFWGDIIQKIDKGFNDLNNVEESEARRYIM